MEQVKQVIICSAGHSGSTLLDMVIGAHSMCESLGELVLLPMEFAMNTSCTCGNEMRRCPLWSEVGCRLGIDVKNDPYALNLGFIRAKVGDPRVTSCFYSWNARFWTRVNYLKLKHNLPLPKKLTQRYDDGITNTKLVFEIVRQLTGKSIVIDSSKQHNRAVSLYLSDPEHTRLIMLVRDGRGVFYSSLKRGYDRRISLNGWYNYYNHLRSLLARYVPERHVLEVKYEDFVMHTELECRRICDFLGIAFEPNMIDFISVTHHNVNGNDIRFMRNSEMHLDEKWKNQLSSADISFFERYAGSMNRLFGYKD
ncbi:sulfotransferase [Nitrosomonas sp.]|uniref:sulfotransferase family protein n=1 Tax=Nitrosomonas sp. TaxID=42353 RepID=UPI0027320BCE|nr:sulfotransferase [Nitrosomonas sp.]MDP1788086.1 sulfotransferase [Nitrosomonas sp.]